MNVRVHTHTHIHIGCAGRSAWTPGIWLHTNAHSTTHKHTLWLCGFLCGDSAHPDSDRLGPHYPNVPSYPRVREGGIAQTCWAHTSSAVGREPADGARSGGGGTHVGRRAEIREVDLLRRKERKRSGRKEKDGGSVSRGYLSHSLSYTKFPSEAVILETEK